MHYVIGCVLAENPRSAVYQADHMRALKQFYERLPADRFARIVALAGELTARDNDQEFFFGLGLILDGIERRLAPGSADRGPEGVPDAVR